MGALAARDMLAHSDLDTALSWHLRSNHYPPVPLTMLPVCKAAIKAVNEGVPGAAIDLPEGVTWRGATSAPASEVVRGHHLGDFLAERD